MSALEECRPIKTHMWRTVIMIILFAFVSVRVLSFRSFFVQAVHSICDGIGSTESWKAFAHSMYSHAHMDLSNLSIMSDFSLESFFLFQ